MPSIQFQGFIPVASKDIEEVHAGADQLFMQQAGVAVALPIQQVKDTFVTMVLTEDDARKVQSWFNINIPRGASFTTATEHIFTQLLKLGFEDPQEAFNAMQEAALTYYGIFKPNLKAQQAPPAPKTDEEKSKSELIRSKYGLDF